MRVIAVHEDVIVATGAIWKTTCTAVRSGGEALLIDSPILPEELEALPAMLGEAGFPIDGLLVTHGDWDHLLGRYAFPGARVECGESTAARMAAAPEEAAGELRDFDEEYLIDRAPPFELPEMSALPVPGTRRIGEAELELHPADGHTSDGMAVWIPWAKTLVCGDYLSPDAIPELSPSSSLDGYLATLERLTPLVEAADAVAPGHGEPLDSARAIEVLREDVAYVEALRRSGAEAPLPPSRRTGGQQRLHEYNVTLLP